MPGPAGVHGPWCGSRTWPTACRRCGDRIFFFSCDCGSRVLFDQLGRPWPVHDCDASWARRVVRRVSSSGEIVVAVAEGVAAIRTGADFDIDLTAGTRRTRRPSDWLSPIERMDPAPGAHDVVTGVVREIRLDVDPYTALGVLRGPIGAAALGPIGERSVSRLTVHAPSPEEVDLLESFTAWVPSDLLVGVSRNGTVTMDIEAVHVLGSDCVWYCPALILES